MSITIAYLTMRKEPLLNWFFDGLKEQKKEFPDLKIQVLFIDYWKEIRNYDFGSDQNIEVLHVEPLPSPWQGRYQVSKSAWFAAANARNTAFVYGQYPAIAFCDDLTVIGDEWLRTVVESSVHEKLITLGAYSKQHDMVVENGRLISGRLESYGHDARGRFMKGVRTTCEGSNFFGCSFVIPLEAGLSINGFDCLTDSIGYEDCSFGVRLQNGGYQFVYDKRLLTTESCDHPQKDFQVKRVDKMLGVDLYNKALERFNCVHTYPMEANKDCSHIIVEVGKQKIQPVWNFFSLRELRAKRERGQEITLSDINYPLNTWYDGTEISNDENIIDIR